MAMAGGFQNFYKGSPGVQPLSAETIAQQVFPYHTFVIIDGKTGKLLQQHTLIINPQEMSQREATRAQVFQTLGGAYVDDFGRGLPKVSISGNTGWRLKYMPDGKGLLDGWQAFKTLRSDIFRYFTDAKDPVRPFLRNVNYEMHWYNWGEDEYYAIQPEEFQLQRSASNPLLYQYTLSYTCIRDLSIGYDAGKGKPTVVKLGNTNSVKDATIKMAVDISSLGQLAKLMEQK
jgi:hypothetical protein